MNRQRGLRVYERSIDAIRKLNDVGYGMADGLPLDLVYNPIGATLPPPQDALEADCRRELRERFGIEFTRLIAITNIPIARFLHDLVRDGRAAGYQQLLREKFNPETIAPLMCRHQIHVSCDGELHDCDFIYALGLTNAESLPAHINDFDPEQLGRRLIRTGEHCFGCTAGRGSSCGGALA